MRQSAASAGTSTRETKDKATARARRDAARRRVLARSPSWHGQNNGQERSNLVYEIDRAVLRLGEVMDHTQADQTRLYQAGKFLVRNLVAKFGHLLEGH